MAQSSIEWTEMTWNPTTGCSKVSQGCKHCYAEIMSRRLQAMGVEKYKNGFKIAMHEDALDIPYSWKKPRIVFVNSMSDLFHPDVTLDFIKKTFKVMNECPQHTFQVLTKRPERLRNVSDQLTWTDNIWMGTSVENEAVLSRKEDLVHCGAKIKFLSLEPLLGPLPNLTLNKIDWAIVGGESGPGARPIEEEWVLEIRDKCEESGTAFFFKQWGGVRKKENGRELAGQTYDEMPDLVAI